MFSWFEYEIPEIPKADYLVLLGILATALMYLVVFSYGAFKNYRFMDSIVTSKVGLV